MPILTTEKLDELERLLEQATPGDWEWYKSNSYNRIGLANSYCEIIYPVKYSDGHPGIEWRNDADAKLILASRNALPALIAAARKGLDADWRPIEEYALGDGIPVLVFCPDADEPKVVLAHRLTFDGDPDGPQWWDFWGENSDALSDSTPPSHYATIPTPPGGEQP